MSTGPDTLYILRNRLGILCPAYAFHTEEEAVARRDQLNARLLPAASPYQPFTVARLHADPSYAPQST